MLNIEALIIAAEDRIQRHDLRLALTTAMQTLSGVEASLSAGQNDEERLRGLEGGAAASYFAAYTQMFPGIPCFSVRLTGLI